MKLSHRIRCAAWMGFILLLITPLAVAAQYDLKEMTPQVQQALSNRQSRYEQLQRFKSEGVVGENNRGYVAVLSEQAGVAGFVSAENQDRQTIYQAIATQNNLGPSGLAIVETVFSEVHHEKSRPGDPVQLATGQWVKK